MILRNLGSVIVIIFLVGIHPVYSQLKLADIFSDNMVLQRDEPIKIWGNASPYSKVEIIFLNTQQETVANSDGEWNVVFNRQDANLNPLDLKVRSSEESISFKNILIGDIWLLIGQSNMEWPMTSEMHYEEEIKEAKNNQLRFYNPKYVGKNIYGQAYNKNQRKKLASGELFYDENWEVSDKSSFAAMSAVGYYFGKKITTTKNIPVGLINLSIGGAPLETFVARETLESSKKFSKKTKGNWVDNEHLPVWIRERGGENTNGHQIGGDNSSGPNHSYKPGFAFSTGIAPILKMPIKGILWYQGESNAQEIERVEEYPDLQKLMVEDFRRKWDQADLPFYWVQLSSIDTLSYNSKYWPEFRDGQRRALEKISNGGMAVSIDIGHKNDVHPRNKKDVGVRLARWALNWVYQEDILVSGPLPKKAEYINGELIITFDHSGSGLQSSPGKNLRGFSIDGKNHVNAIIKEDQVVIKTPEKPKYVFYGWEPFSNGNLLNSEDLPASTFKIKIVKK